MLAVEQITCPAALRSCLLALRICYFSHGYDKLPGKSNFGKERFLLAQFRGAIYQGEKARWGKPEAAGSHCLCSQEAEGGTLVLSSLSPFNSSRDLSPWRGDAQV